MVSSATSRQLIERHDHTEDIARVKKDVKTLGAIKAIEVLSKES
jgi:hypothetical protein